MTRSLRTGRCLLHSCNTPGSSQLRFSRTISTSIPEAPPPPPPSGAVHLTTRRLIELRGQDAPKFLQGLVTNNVDPSSHKGFFTAFLTAQGRVLNDAFIYPDPKGTESGYILDVDSGVAQSVLRQIKKHKLRSKFSVRLLDDGEAGVWSLWRASDKWTPHSVSAYANDDANASHDGTLCLTDTRATAMGKRAIVKGSARDAVFSEHSCFHGLSEAPLSAYTIRRYVRGVIEGHDEIPPDTTLPMNINLDTMHAIDFRKGCYLGQELTIRTHHTGVVRKRVLPVALYSAGQDPPTHLEYDARAGANIGHRLPYDTDIKSGTHRRKPGSFIAGVGNIGLAMCRLEIMTDLAVTPEPSPFSPQDRFKVKVEVDGTDVEYGVQAFVPDWLRGRVRTATPQKRIET